MMRIRLVPAILVAFLFLGGCEAPLVRRDTSAATQATRTAEFVNAHAIIIVRHGDIDVAQKASLGNRTPLLPAGEARARELTAMLRDAGVNRVVTSSALRTQQTAAPLVQFLKDEKIDISPEDASGNGAQRPARSPTAAAVTGAASSNGGVSSEAADLVAFLARTSKPTDVILLVHHHSVIPSLVEAFSHTPEPPIDDATEFDRCYVILPDAVNHTYRVLRLRYGVKAAPAR